MVTGPTSGPTAGHALGLLARSLIVPAAVAAAALVIAGVLGHLMAGALVAVGLLLGVCNGLYAQSAAARLVPGGPSRGVIIGGSLRRLGIVTIVALAIAWLARPTGWTVLVGLVIYQLLSVGSAVGAAMREARGA